MTNARATNDRITGKARTVGATFCRWPPNKTACWALGKDCREPDLCTMRVGMGKDESRVKGGKIHMSREVGIAKELRGKVGTWVKVGEGRR